MRPLIDTKLQGSLYLGHLINWNKGAITKQHYFTLVLSYLTIVTHISVIFTDSQGFIESDIRDPQNHHYNIGIQSNPKSVLFKLKRFSFGANIRFEQDSAKLKKNLKLYFFQLLVQHVEDTWAAETDLGLLWVRFDC